MWCPNDAVLINSMSARALALASTVAQHTVIISGNTRHSLDKLSILRICCWCHCVCCAIVWTRQNIDIVRSCVKIADLSEWKTTLRASHLMHTKERTQVKEGSLLAFIFEFRIRDNEKHTVDRNTGQPTNKRLDEKKWQAALSACLCNVRIANLKLNNLHIFALKWDSKRFPCDYSRKRFDLSISHSTYTGVSNETFCCRFKSTNAYCCDSETSRRISWPRSRNILSNDIN